MDQGLAGGGLGGVTGAPAPAPVPAPAGGLAGSVVGVPGRSSDGVEIASSFDGCKFDDVGVAVLVDAELVGSVPEELPGIIEPPGPYAGAGKSSHSEQWKIDQWA